MCRLGKILRRNKDARQKVNKQAINFYVYYDVDEQKAAHALSLDNYHGDGTGEAPHISKGFSWRRYQRE